MSSQNQNKQVQCYVCLNIMRSDTLKHHVGSKDADMEKPVVKEKLLIDNGFYYKKSCNCKILFYLVTSGCIEQQSLSKELEMHTIIDMESAELRLW